MTESEFKEVEQTMTLPQELGGHKLRIKCIGSTFSGPTVVLESGLGCPGSYWTGIAREVSKFSYVCFYDRAGYGDSELGPLPRTVDRLAIELHALLKQAKVPTPYILVGHSFGGLIVRMYERKFPDDVIGMMLLDTPHEAIYETGYFSSSIINKLSEIYFFENNLRIEPIVDSEQSNVDLCLKDLREASKINPIPLGNKALVVIQRGKDDLDYFREHRVKIMGKLTKAEQVEFDYVLEHFKSVNDFHQIKLSQLSRKSRPVVIAQESGHNIPLMQPSLVIDELKKLTEELGK